MIPKFFFFMLGGLAGMALPLAAQAPAAGANPPPDNSNLKQYVYKTADGKPLSLAVFSAVPAPSAGTAVPVMILFHGGGWTRGDRGALYPQCRYFSHRGIAAVSVDYRYLDKKATDWHATPVICLQDAKSAIRWVRSHATELGIDPKRVILGGGSAGGHLATMAQLDTSVNDPTDDTSIPTTCVAMVLFNPAYMQGAQPVIDGNTKMDAKLEPFPYVSASVPPMIMFFGDQDPLEKQAEAFVKPCLAAGVKAQIWIAPGQKHSFFNKPEWVVSTCVQADTFLTSLGLLAPPTTPLPVPTAKLVPGLGAP
jgi:acetyl esterase/lipase